MGGQTEGAAVVDRAPRTYDIEQFARDYGISRNTAYRHAGLRADGDVTATPFPVVRIGSRLIIPAEPYDRVLRGENVAAGNGAGGAR